MAVNTSPNEGLYRYGGMYGSAWRGTTQLAEVVEVTANAEINRIEVPLVGQMRQGYKPGRVSREGTIRIQQMDSAWQLEVWEFLNMSIEERRQARDAGNSVLKPFTLLLEIDDPDALGVEKWQLDGCLITWRLSLGFSVTDDIIDREFPLTWISEKPIHAFKRTTGAGGAAAAQKVWNGGTKV